MQVVRAAALAGLLCGSGAEAGPGLGPLLGRGHGNHSHSHEEPLTFGGVEMQRTYMVYDTLPVGEKELRHRGWTKHNTECNPKLGFVWTQDPSGATESHPVKLYTTAAGQPSGVGVIYLGKWWKPALPASQRWVATPKPLCGPEPSVNVAHIDLAFRSGDVVCSGLHDPEPIGNVLIVNPTGTSKTLPVTEEGVIKAGFKRGSCFDGMGFHWFLNTAANGQMPNSADNLFPIVPMYHEGTVNAIFFVTPNNEVTIPFIDTNEWEPIALTSSMMCQNTCEKDCSFTGASSFSTMHIYFRDHSLVKCAADLQCKVSWPTKISCCPAADVVV